MVRNFCNGITAAQKKPMLDVALSVVALIAGGLILEAFAAAKAPLGYQDSHGFHFGTETKKKSFDPNEENPN